MPKCSYCGKVYDIPRGLTYVMKDGVIKYLCSSKCRKNMLMHRRNVKWVLNSKKESEKVVVEENSK
ncbi:MAG: 50S ribosomal protein L24e [archaeon]